MKVYERTRKITYVVVGGMCNKCGVGKVDELTSPTLHSFKVENGYGDKHDGQTHFFDLCDKCYCALIKRFEYPVDLKEDE